MTIHNPFELEKHMISPTKWTEIYDEAPPVVRRMIDEVEQDPWSQGCSIGIGHKPGIGWFVLGTGQGPFVIWVEGQPDIWKTDSEYMFNDTSIVW